MNRIIRLAHLVRLVPISDISGAQSITSSAVASIDSGRLRPSAFAVFRLTIDSYLVGACNGISLGFSPLRVRSTYSATRLSYVKRPLATFHDPGSSGRKVLAFSRSIRPGLSLSLVQPADA